jgi:hypothetical protein
MITLLFKLLAGHALGDYALQGDFIAKFKSRHTPSPEVIWPYVLTSHALIHGLFVYLATGSTNLGIAETCAHWIIDFCKCEKWFGIHVDQIFHIWFKILWVYLLVVRK